MVLQAQDSHQQYPECGERLYTRLSSAPFPHPRRASGHTYGRQQFPADKHYHDSSVAIFIPKGYRQTDAVDIVVHLHGWWNTIDTVLKRYRLPQQIAESLMEDLRGWGIPYFAEHETTLAPSDLSTNRLIFIRSDLGHDMVMHGRMQYRDYLKASGLPDM
ncbi:MAG: hypothetical protein Q8P51_04880 [Ignavibacteria bacterium]|nr:hypothetical protein [Ignavibacteria bacterium]